MPTEQINTFMLSLPEGWHEIDLDPDAVAEVLAEHAPESDDEEVQRAFRRQVLVARRIVAQVQQGGVTWAAAMGETHEEGGEVFGLTCLAYLAVQSAADVGADQLTFEQLREAASAELPVGQDRLQQPQLVDLTAGPALRDRILHRDTSSEEVETHSLDVRYHVLVGSGDGFAVLGFITPNVELADELGELFEAIAQTLEFVAV